MSDQLFVSFANRVLQMVGRMSTGEILGSISILPSLCSNINVNEHIGSHVYVR
jgi:hypothetical protein